MARLGHRSTRRHTHVGRATWHPRGCSSEPAAPGSALRGCASIIVSAGSMPCVLRLRALRALRMRHFENAIIGLSHGEERPGDPRNARPLRPPARAGGPGAGSWRAAVRGRTRLEPSTAQMQRNSHLSAAQAAASGRGPQPCKAQRARPSVQGLVARACHFGGKVRSQCSATSRPVQNHTRSCLQTCSRNRMSPAALPGRPVSRSCRPMLMSFGTSTPSS
jgi:hypothetical protein